MEAGAARVPRDDECVALEAALEGGGLICLFAPIADRRAALTPAETQSVARAVGKRQLEYAAGRWLARRALAHFALGGAELLAANDRQPLWPAPVVGSITHAGGHAAVAVGRREIFRGIGLDLERGGRVGPELVARLLTSVECERYRDGDATLVFSAKEACYKLLFPMFGEFIGFHEVEIDVEPLPFAERGRFSARYLGLDPRHEVLSLARGRYLRLADNWLTCITLAAGAPA